MHIFIFDIITNYVLTFMILPEIKNFMTEMVVMTMCDKEHHGEVWPVFECFFNFMSRVTVIIKNH